MSECNDAAYLREVIRENEADKAGKKAWVIARKHARLSEAPDDLKDIIAEAAGIAASQAVRAALMEAEEYYCQHVDLPCRKRTPVNRSAYRQSTSGSAVKATSRTSAYIKQEKGFNAQQPLKKVRASSPSPLLGAAASSMTIPKGGVSARAHNDNDGGGHRAFQLRLWMVLLTPI